MQAQKNLKFNESIRKTCQCNVYPLEPHFYIVKLGFTGVYLFFLFLLQNIEAVLTCTHNLCFEQKKKKKNIKIFLMKLSFFTIEKNLGIMHGQVFVLGRIRSWYN